MISREEIDNLAELARLKLSDAEAEALRNDISNILDYVGQIRVAFHQGDTSTSRLSKVSPLALRNVMREDVPRAEDDILAGKEEALLAALPRREGDFAVVRKIIQKDE